MTNIGCNPSLSAPSPPCGGRGRLTHWLALGLAPALMVAALGCREDAESPTAPTSRAEAGGPAFSHTAGHKVVNSLADPGDGTCNASQCTLREAINDPGSTEVSFAPGLTGIIMLAQPAAGGGTLVIEKTLSITGPRPAIEIRRLRTDPAFRIFRIGSGVTVTLRNLTIRNGKDNPGAGILNLGTLRLIHCTVAGSAGVGIFNQNHTLTLTRSTVAHNGGVGIFNQGGTLALTHSTVLGNSFGGIISSGGTATLSRARIIGNSGNAGILASDSRVTVTHSTIARNTGGGIANQGSRVVTIRNSTIVGNSTVFAGGGIFNQSQGALTLTNSTVSGNSAAFGGGISDGGFGGANLTLTNSTVAGNSATQEGGGIGLFGDESSIVVLTNNLVAENSAPTGPDVLHSGLGGVTARFNLIGDGSGSGITNTDGNQVGNVPPNGSPIDPRLGPLAQNGGPTRTHSLDAGSPAIDAASTPGCPPTDQRGVPRPQGAACDIGSYERE